MAVHEGIDDGDDVGSTGGVQRCEDAVIVSVEAIERLSGREVHLMTTKMVGDDCRGHRHSTVAGHPIVGLTERGQAAGTPEVES